MRIIHQTSGYSVILAIVMTGFMLMLTTGIFMLVLGENKDTKALEYYFKSGEGAQGALELAMLQAKKYNYSYDEKLHNEDPLSKVLFEQRNEFHKNKDVQISYDLSSITSEIIDKTVEVGGFDIIPLFSYDAQGVYRKVKNISLTGLDEDVVWNIVGENGGISGVGDFHGATLGNDKTISGDEVAFEKKTVGDFLTSSEKNYLVLHNVGSLPVKYSLKSLNAGEYFTKAHASIIATGEIGGYKQNLKITIDNSQYLNLLKYSIFSN